MKLIDAEKIVEFMNQEGVDADLLPEYSGRGMYGKTTAAITCASRDSHMIGYAAGQLGIPASNLPYSEDSMGKDRVYY